MLTPLMIGIIQYKPMVLGDGSMNIMSIFTCNPCGARVHHFHFGFSCLSKPNILVIVLAFNLQC